MHACMSIYLHSFSLSTSFLLVLAVAVPLSFTPPMDTAAFHPHSLSDNTTNNVTATDDDFLIEDLLDFPNDDAIPDTTGLIADSDSSSSTLDAAATAFTSANSHPIDSTGNHQLAAEFSIPLDDVAELEWLSNFVEESFSSSDELQKLQFVPTIPARRDEPTRQYHFQPGTICPASLNPSPILHPEVSVPAKARSKRSRAAPGNWTSRLLAVSPTPQPPAATSSSSDSSDVVVATATATMKKAAKRSKKEGISPDPSASGEERRCLHCSTDKTPQWRTGPMGPKTLCNACGVRYKSGRLVPEYRPAASPTFVLAKHSNSHRKVLELRRQKELTRTPPPLPPPPVQQSDFMNHHQHPGMMAEASSSSSEDFLIHQHMGPDFRQLV